MLLIALACDREWPDLSINAVQGKTEVLVDEARNMVSYVLDENLIDFGTALEEQDYDRYPAKLL